MPYSDPTRSPYCAARHLLRRLGDAAALRRNPIVSRTLGTGLPDDELVREARALVDRAFAAIDASSATVGLKRCTRHAAILLRCDVLREPRATVAHDLGLSIPQFERERRTAMARFSSYVQSVGNGRRAEVQAVRSDLASMVRRRALRLADSGDRPSALVLLDDVARTASHEERIEALLAVCEIETNDHAVARARGALESARALVAARNVPNELLGRLELGLETASLRVLTLEYGPQAAENALRFREDLPRCPQGVALLLAQAEVLDGCGRAPTCAPLVARASDMLSGLSDADDALRIDLEFLRAQTAFWLDPSVRGRSGLDAAVSMARRAGYAGRGVFAELSRLGGVWACSDDGRARRAYRGLLERIGRATTIPRQIQFFSYWDAADIECGIGDPWRAAEAARKALALAPSAGRASVIQSLLARAYGKGGRPAAAERLALEIIDHPRGSQTGTALLYAKRTLADVASRTGRLRQSWESLYDAAELARRYGTARLAAELADRLARFRFHRFGAAARASEEMRLA